MSNADRSECTACGGNEVYSTQTGANGGYGPSVLPGLGRLFKPAKMNVYLCARCGHVAIFADDQTRKRVQESGRWKKVR